MANATEEGLLLDIRNAAHRERKIWPPIAVVAVLAIYMGLAGPAGMSFTAIVEIVIGAGIIGLAVWIMKFRRTHTPRQGAGGGNDTAR